MAKTLTTKQRNALPRSAFALPGSRRYPIPTKAQARRVGISETNRLKMHRAALSYSGRQNTASSHAHTRRIVARRSQVGGHYQRKRTR